MKLSLNRCFPSHKTLLPQPTSTNLYLNAGSFWKQCKKKHENKIKFLHTNITSPSDTKTATGFFVHCCANEAITDESMPIMRNMKISLIVNLHRQYSADDLKKTCFIM